MFCYVAHKKGEKKRETAVLAPGGPDRHVHPDARSLYSVLRAHVGPQPFERRPRLLTPHEDRSRPSTSSPERLLQQVGVGPNSNTRSILKYPDEAFATYV